MIPYIQAIPLETWGVLGGLLAAALGGRYAWVAKAAQALLTAAAADHPGDHDAQLMHVANAKKGKPNRAAARRAARIIRKRMAETGK